MNNEKRNSNWLTICLIGLVVIFALIGLYAGVRAYWGNKTVEENNPQQSTDVNNNQNPNTENANGTTNTTPSPETLPAIQTFDNVTSLELDTLTYAVVVKQDNVDKVQVECNNVSSDYKITLEPDGTLHLTGNHNASHTAEGSVIITLPTDFTLQECDINGGTGVLSISNLTCRDFDFDCGTGNAILSDVSLSDTDIDCSTGLLEISGSLAGESDITCHSGQLNLKLTDYNDNYNIKLLKGSGQLIVNGEAQDTFSLTSANPSNFIEIEGGSGIINIEF